MMVSTIRQGMVSAAILVALGSQAYSSDKAWIEQKLAEFNANPQAFIFDQKNVLKYNPKTLQPLKVQSKFTQASIDSGRFVEEKDKARQELLESNTFRASAEIKDNDRAEDLVDDFQYKTLQEMDAAHLRSVQLSTTPWSGSYWPIYMGGMAFRYADAGFPFSENWKENTDYLLKATSAVADLSPAEKYDLLLGDKNKTLTSHMIDHGRGIYDKFKQVEGWLGYCHGWSPASFMLQRPKSIVKVLAADKKTEIPFYPDDVKALATALWANGTAPLRLISGRCDLKRPKDDRGHTLAQECFDTNPGTWHLSVVNQMGVSKRPLVFDSTYDYEVWTQPTYSYKYSYFNPQTGKAVDKLDDAIVKKAEFTNDKFAKYRSANTKFVAGIAFNLIYVNENRPSHRETDSPAEDERASVTYLYDVELNQDKAIIGGEWYQLQHPDFLFVPEADSQATTAGDHYLYWRGGGKWDGKGPVPNGWYEAALVGSRKGQPLAAVVEKLIELSNPS